MRPILAVIAGYLVMVIIVMVTLTVAWTILGPSFAYRHGTTHVTLAWIGFNLPISILAAIAGGYVTEWVSPSDTLMTVKVLAGIILGLDSSWRSPTCSPIGRRLNRWPTAW